MRAMKNATRAIPVDLLRVFAASSIFYFHGGLAVGWPLFQWGEFAVATFIFLTSACTVRYSQPAAGKAPAYWWSRFKAIYPTFAVISVIIYAASFLYAPRKTGSHYTLTDLASNLLMTSQFIGKPWMSDPMWFVPFVLQIYFILPLLIRIPVRWHAMPVAFLISGTACAAVYALLPVQAGLCRSWSPIFRLPEVLFGCLLGRARSLAGAVAPVVIYVVCCALVALLAIPYPQASLMLLLPLKGVLVFLVLAALVAAIMPFIKNEPSKFIALLGRASFPFFLLHGTGIGFISDRFGWNILPWILYFVLSWAAAIILMLTLGKTQRRPGVRGAPAMGGVGPAPE